MSRRHGEFRAARSGTVRHRRRPPDARRIEEVGQLPAYRIVDDKEQDCGGGWRFHILLADVDGLFDAYTQHETDATGWFTRAQMRELSLHPGMGRWLDEFEGTRAGLARVARPSEGTCGAPTARRRP
jgi:hypothetical protein